ncbi:MAG: YceI family protein [Anaerolineales bacterium]|nr:YceI family protein [Anaerolineales bacterium]MCB9129253.1 YceI family protein [Ardenticatenales bacterium]
MKQTALLFVALLALVGAYFVYTTLRPAEEASAPISALPLQSSATAATSVEESAEAAMAETPQAAVPTAEGEATNEPEAVIYEIDPQSSTVSFTIDEVLNGAPKTVVGTTDQVAGQILLNLSDPSKSEVGVIQVNARTFVTDNNNRNNAIKNRILSTNDYEFLTLTPTRLDGLPAAINNDDSYRFTLTGDLTIRDITRETVWEVTVTPSAQGQLIGTASTTVVYADWNIAIPSVPAVASVEDTVLLQIDFTANPV